MDYEETMKDRFKYALDTLLIEKYRLLSLKRTERIMGTVIAKMDKDLEQIDSSIEILRGWKE